MTILGIIPARYSSTRFPGKPLVDIHGKSMIRRVYEQAQLSEILTDVVVATDDTRIFQHVMDFGGKAVMTASSHQSGTDRCAEVLSQFPAVDAVINIQGDEPFIHPSQIDLVGQQLLKQRVQIATLVKKIHQNSELINVNSPKVVLSQDLHALYFSRQVIPYLRDVPPELWLEKQVFYKHIGIYGYKSDVLQQLTKLPISSLEQAEGLEQLRWLEAGFKISVAETERETQAVDHPEDLIKLLPFYTK